MDKVKEYLENLRASNPGLLSQENRGQLMKMMQQDLVLEFQSERALVSYAKNSGFEFPLSEKKNNIQNENTELDSQSDLKTPSLVAPSIPIQDGGGVVDLSAAQKRSNFVSDLRDTERGMVKESLYSDITASFLDTDEGEAKVNLTKKLIGKGFQINERQGGSNAIEIVSPNGNSLDVDLSYDFQDRVGDFFDKNIIPSPLGLAGSAVSSVIAASSSDGANRSMNLVTQAKSIRDFLTENTMDLTFAFQDQFSTDKIKATEKLFTDIFETERPYPVDGFLSNLNQQISEKRKALEEKTYRAANPGERLPLDYEERDLEATNLSKEVERLESTKTSLLNKKNSFSRTLADLINTSESLYNFGERDLKKMMKMGLDPKDLKLYGIEIDGVTSSYNELQNLLSDDKLRKAVKSGEISLKVNSTGAEESVVKDLMKSAMDLTSNQMNGNYVATILQELGASALETLDDVEEAVGDIQSAVGNGALRLANKVLMGDKYNPETIDAFFESIYIKKHSYLKDKAKKIRVGQLEVKGDMASSESFGEFMFKGGKAAAQSAPIMAAYLVAPEVGLALTGLSSYGSSMGNSRDIMDYIKETGDPTGMYTGYRDLTISRARAISASKAITETAFTYAFTYNFLKGLGGASKEISGMTRNEGRKLINFYSKSFAANMTKIGGQSVLREIPEEELITVTNMYLDEFYGIEDYSMKDYTRAMKNTAISVPFSTLPLSGVAYNKMDKTSKDFVGSMIARFSIDDSLQADFDSLNQLDYEIEQKGEENVEKSILDERDAIAGRINEEHDRKTNAIMKNASDDQVAQMSIIMNDMHDKAKQYASEDQPRMRKHILDALKNLNGRADAILEAIGVTKPMAEIDLSGIPVNKSKPNKTALKVVERLSEKLENTETTNNFRKELVIENISVVKLEEMSKFLSEITEADLTSDQNKIISEMYASVIKTEDWGVGFDKYYNRLVGADKIVAEIIAAKPTSDKLKPMTGVEALFTGYKGGADLWNMANMNHIMSFMFKNDRMGAPIKNLSGRIDANASNLKNKIDREKGDFAKAVFLTGKVTKRRLANLTSDAGAAEMMILSELTKQREDEGSALSFARKKAILNQNKGQLKKYDDSEAGRNTQNIYAVAYDRLLGSSKNLADVYSKANPDAVAAVKYLSEGFAPIKDRTFNHMRNYHGKEPTVFSNYVPSIISKIGVDRNTPMSSNHDGFVYGPNSMQETISYDKISDTDMVLLYENWTSMVFKSKENLELELGLRTDIDLMKGVIESKGFENMFDTESKSFAASKEGDFAFMKGALGEKLNSLDISIQSLNSAQPRVVSSWDDFVSTASKFTTAVRLSTVSMRASQGSSAMLAALPIVGNRARGMLIGSFFKFASARLTADLESNKDFLEVLDKSSTSRRNSAQQFLPESFKDRSVTRKSTGIIGKTGGYLAGRIQAGSDKTLDVMLGQSDKIAGQATWAAFYLDRMVQTRGSEIKSMNDEQFWAWSKDNTDMDAVAWADSQVDRSQMLSNEWNNGKAFQGKIMSNILFPFGRFAYNRKVGMANDWSIINDDVTATEADKAKAKRRLGSAVVEIGIFKMIQPTVGLMITQAAAGFVAGLVGWDEEYDKAIEIFKKAVGNVDPLGDLPKKDKFGFSNYKTNLGKQFATSLVEGMTPLPAPSAVNEVVFAAINSAAGEDVFNVYSKDIRDIFNSDDSNALSVKGVTEIVTKNMGLASMMLEDGVALYNAIATEVGKMPSPYNGDDVWVIPAALPAAEFLKEYRKINILIQSADLKKLLDKTENLLLRDYTVTKKPDYEAYRAIKDGQGTVELDQ
jgi:hypothetical protein